MKRLLFAATMLIALPAAAFAQAAPPISVGAPPMQGPSRSVSRNGSHGITVSGAGAANIDATSARITLQLSTPDNRLTLDKQSVQPVVDALVRAGADPSSVELPVNFTAPGYSNMAAINAVVKNPSVEKMKSGVVIVGTAIAGMSNVRLMNANVFLRVDDCSKAQADARRRAIDNARAKAAAIAQQLGAKLGNVIDVTSNDQSSPDAGCMSQYWVGPNGAQFNQAYGEATSDQDYISIPVRSFVTITYAIK